MILWSLLWAEKQVATIENTIQKIKTPVRETIVARIRVRLYRQIVLYFEHTPHFPRDECSDYGVSDLPDYLINHLYTVIGEDFDGYTKMVIKGLDDSSS